MNRNTETQNPKTPKPQELDYLIDNSTELLINQYEVDGRRIKQAATDLFQTQSAQARQRHLPVTAHNPRSLGQTQATCGKEEPLLEESQGSGSISLREVSLGRGEEGKSQNICTGNHWLTA